MTTAPTPEAHSNIVGGSTADRRLNCPRSYALQNKLPPDEGSVYAREGTAFHALLAKIIDEDLEPESLLPFTYEHPPENGNAGWSWIIDVREWQELGEPALLAFDRFCTWLEEREGSDPVSLLVETRCAMPGIPGAFGTTDILLRAGDVVVVWDWKMGSTPVPAAENKQLMFYARAAAAEHPGFFRSVREIGLAIMQPRLDEQPDVYWTDWEALETFRQELVNAVDIAVNEGENAPIEKGPWCKFATCKAICPLHVSPAVNLAEKLSKIKAEKGKDVQAVDVLTELPDLLEMADIAKEWAAEVHKLAHKFAEDGGHVEGYKLVEKRSSGRDWAVTEEEVRKWFRNRRFSLDDYMPRSLVTPPAAEKLLKATGRELPETLFKKRPSSGTNLVRESSSREAVQPGANRVAALGRKIMGLVGGQT